LRNRPFRLGCLGNALVLVTPPASPTLRWITAGLLLAAALLAVLLPFVSSTLVTIGLGGVAIAAGVAQLLRLAAAGDTASRLFRGLAGVLYLAGGISVLAFPLEGVLSLTLFVGFLLAFEGVMELATAAAGSIPARGLVLVDGIVTAVLGALLIAEWPGDSLWVIGTVFGVGLAISALNLLTAPAAQPGDQA
jgi:hypothetical protein